MKLCLTMIVKNEAERILRCLTSVADHVVDYAIVDTGSTDGTEQLIRDFFAARGVEPPPGSIIQEPFVDFSTSRNRALRLCESLIRPASRWDYAILVDADMQLQVDREPELTEPAYALIQRNGVLTYWNTRLVHRDYVAAVRYRGVTHEYLETPAGEPAKTHDIWFVDHQDGSNRINKFERDIELLEKGLREEQDENLKTRYYFYIGQTYQAVGRHDEAIVALEERVRRGGWDEEVFYASYQIGQCFLAQKKEREFLGAMVQAFYRRPTRAEPLFAAAHYFREIDSDQAREASLLFSRTGITLPRPNDILFVDDFMHLYGMREEFSIPGYFSKHPETRAKAHAIIEALALDRLTPPPTRDLARRNLFWFAPKLKTLAPSWEAKQIEGFTAPKGWRAMNPSICRFGDELLAVIRCVTYWIESDGSYKFPDSEPAVITRNFLVELDLERPHIVKRTLNEITADLGQMWWGDVRGMEDLRLFTTNPISDGIGGDVQVLWFSCACRQMNEQGICEQLIGSLDLGALNRDVLVRPMRLNTGRYEKNWMPLIGTESPKFIYRVDPTIVVQPDMDALPEGRPTRIAGDNFAGSSQLIRFDGGWLAMEHEPLSSPINGRRLNQQRFVWFTEELELAAISRRFIFELNEEIEYVMGLVDAGDKLIISYGSHDRQAWVGTIDADDVRKMLSKADIPASDVPVPKIEAVGGPSAPTLSWISQPNLAWVTANTNAALRTAHEVDYAAAFLKAMGLPVRDNPLAKSWDNYLAIFYALGTVRPDTNKWVIDAGGTEDAVFLPTLRKIGFKKLANINTAHLGSIPEITTLVDDIEKFDCFARGEVAYIACLSVIEHGVDWRKFLRSAAHVLEPGGHLFVSFDYWQDPLSTTAKIFERGEIENLRGFAEAVGLTLTSPFQWECSDRVVSWDGREYTFANLLFRRQDASSDG